MATGDWTVDANEALRLSLVRAKEDKASLTPREAYEGFHPTFTYPIYGEDEKIYGYDGLAIELKFASGSLAQYLHISHTAKLASSSTVDDVQGTLSNFIPPGYFKDEDEFLKRVEEDATSFRPYGKKIYSYSRPANTLSSKGKNVSIAQVLNPEDEETVEFEVYHSTWETPGFREYHRRMQLFILLYIEGGSFISEDEDVWEFVVLYEKRKRRHTPDMATYHFVGYSTLYPFYCFPEKHRLRLSQFVILPPYQQEGHGSALYTAIYQYVLAQPTVVELTVEDPAEAFEDLRDRNDLKMLLSNERFMRDGFGDGVLSSGGGKVGKVKGINGRGHPYAHRHGHGHHVSPGGHSLGNLGEGGAGGNGNGNGGGKKKRGRMGPPVEKAWAEKWRVELKIASRQFNRLVEMLILKHLDPNDKQANKAFRLQLKERLFRFNFELLMQVDKEERQLKLEETFQSVCEDYRRILAMPRTIFPRFDSPVLARLTAFSVAEQLTPSPPPPPLPPVPVPIVALESTLKP